MIDTHCHILPGIDDGADDLKVSVAMARVAEKDGITTIFATPHMNLDEGYPDRELILAKAAELNEALRHEGIGVQVLPGAEISLTDKLTEFVRDGRALTMGDLGKYLLVELPFTGYPTFVPELFFSVQLLGVSPIIAHPERSAAALMGGDALEQLVNRGALLQVNAQSVMGREGRRVQAIAHKLIKDDRVDFLGSDAHNLRRRPPSLSAATKAFRRIGGDAMFRRLTLTGPERLLKPAQPFKASVGREQPSPAAETGG